MNLVKSDRIISGARVWGCHYLEGFINIGTVKKEKITIVKNYFMKNFLQNQGD